MKGTFTQCLIRNDIYGLSQEQGTVILPLYVNY